MSEKTIENNKVSVIGKIVSDFTFSHEVFGEGFYLVDLEVNRLSDQADVIPLMISERLVDVTGNYLGCTVEAIGQFRSYNRHEGSKNRLVLSVFVREIHFMEEFTDYTKTNQIFLDGYICKTPIYRKTPLGRGNCGYSAGGEPGRMANPITYRVLPGAETPDTLLISRWEPESHLGKSPEPGIYQEDQRVRV